MKKWIYISACLTVSVMLLTGCGSDQVSTDEIKAAIQESADGPTTITFKSDNGEVTNYTVTEDGDKITVTDEDGKTICTFSVNDFSK